MNDTLKRILPKFALFSAALIWGSSFFIVKNTVDIFPTNFLLAIRFTIGCLLLCVLFPKKLTQLNRTCLWQGIVLGLLIFTAYCIQTIGLTDTTPGKNAFLTAAYCILVPFLYWITDKRRPDLYNFSAAFLCLAGIGLVSFDGSFSMRFGDAMTLVSALFFAAHIVAGARFGGKSDPILLTILQFGTAAVCSWVLGYTTETFPKEIPLNAALGLLYLAVFATTIALLLQNIGLKYADPTSGAILLSLESVFGVLFSMLFYQERLTLRLGAGFLLIFIAVILSETKLSFLRKKRS
mgnify:CR=1 FL=1